MTGARLSRSRRGPRAPRLRRPWGKERTPQRARSGPAPICGRTARAAPARTRPPAARSARPASASPSGEVWAVHTGWSGNHTHYAERVFTGEQVLGGGELLLPGEVVLAPGESYRSPWVYGAYGVGLDAVARRFHRHLRARPEPPRRGPAGDAERLGGGLLRPRPGPAARPGRAGRRRSASSATCSTTAGSAPAATTPPGSATGWCRPRSGREGLHPLVDRVRELGMQFGLWFEPEMVNPDSDVARAHPEWIMATGAGWPVESRPQQVLNLGHPGGYEHVSDADPGDPRRVRRSATSSGTTTAT